VGLTVAQLTELRKKARESGVFLKVAKNTLVRRAVEGTEYVNAADKLVGPLVYAFSVEDPGAAGRLVKEFAKGNDKLKAKLVAIGGQVYPGSHVDVLASLPTREQALAMLASLLAQPATMLARVLAEPASQMARAIGAVSDQKQAA
jgi:large subunit ribosomal protein L10